MSVDDCLCPLVSQWPVVGNGIGSGVDLFWGVVVIAAPCSQGLSWRAAVSFLFVL
jgi:hypothetical protein